MNRAIWTAAALGLATLGLAGCGERPEEAQAATAGAQGISVSDARLMLPAVAGNPGAVYFAVKNDGERTRMIQSVAVAGAGNAMMHSSDMQEMLQVAVGPGGGTAEFAPGEQHVMAFDLADTVAAGSQADVTLTFLGGQTFTFPAEVRAAGDER